MKKVKLTLNPFGGTMHDSEGRLMFETGNMCSPTIYHDLPYDAAVKIQMSYTQAQNEHNFRMLELGLAHAEELKAKV